jgi:hypothetical protein
MTLILSWENKIPEADTKKVSDKKLHANKKNAQLSTGPKTAKGKKTSSQNAITHGLLVRDIVIEGLESKKEFDNLLDVLIQDFQPVGGEEELLVQQFAVCYWRCRREYLCEKADSTLWQSHIPIKETLDRTCRYGTANFRRLCEVQKRLDYVQARRTAQEAKKEELNKNWLDFDPGSQEVTL